MLIDDKGRKVSYLRLSVTDRCNLLCRYCTGRIRTFIPHGDILRYEEMEALVGAALKLGVGKVRLTGGEPFVRRGFTSFVEQLLGKHPDLDLRITTNATLLGPRLERLHAAGLRRLNISLDTLNRDRYRHVAGRDFFTTVYDAILKAVDLGFTVKINAVGLMGLNDDELPAFLDLARNTPLDVRFIEFMPMGGCGRWAEDMVWSSEQILASANEIAELEEISPKGREHGPARVFSIKNGKGRLGLISPLTGHFCGSCNRLRVTSDGNLRTCLYSDRVYHLRPLLRHPKLGLARALDVMHRATLRKPVGADILHARNSTQLVCGTGMASIGG